MTLEIQIKQRCLVTPGDVLRLFEKRYVEVEIGSVDKSGLFIDPIKEGIATSWFYFFVKKSPEAQRLLANNTDLMWFEGSDEEVAYQASQWVAETRSMLAVYECLDITAVDQGNLDTSVDDTTELLLDISGLDESRIEFMECICGILGIDCINSREDLYIDTVCN